MSDPIGVHVSSAISAGRSAETLAESLSSVVSRFDMATEELASSLHGPFGGRKSALQGAYRSFAEKHVGQMWQIQEHGRRLAGNVRAGAEQTGATDEESAAFYRSAVDLPEVRDPIATEDYYVMDRWVNRA